MRIITVSMILLISNILQSTIFDMVRIRGVSPNLNIMIIVSFALLRGSKEGTLIGFFAGLTTDILFGKTIGYLAIVGAGIGYFCGKFNKNFYRENLILPFLLTIVSTIVYGVFISFTFLLRGQINYIYFFKNIIIPETIYTVIISVFIYQLMYFVNEMLERNEKTQRNIF